MNILQPDAGLRVDGQFEAIVATSFSVLLPTAADFELSKPFLQRYETKLRIGDAFHLAIAKNNNARIIHSFDKGLLHAATILGLPASSGI